MQRRREAAAPATSPGQQPFDRRRGAGLRRTWPHRRGVKIPPKDRGRASAAGQRSRDADRGTLAGDVTILDLKGKMTLGEGDEMLKDKINSLIHQGHKKLLLNLAEVPTSTARASARSCAPTPRSAGRAAA
jgi:hypothetical protein